MRLGMAGADGPAARVLAPFTAGVMHPSTLRRLTNAAGATMRQLERERTAATWATGADAETETAPTGPLHLSVDGSRVALVGEGWRAVKLAAIGERQADGPLTALT